MSESLCGDRMLAAQLFLAVRSMTLASQIANDTLKVFFNTDDMAEFGTYCPKGGIPQRVLFVRFASPETTDVESHHQLRNDQQQIQIPVGGANGITNPQLGDWFRFPEDAATVFWDFLQVVDSDLNVFNIKWQQKTMQRAGHAVAPQL